MTYEEVLALVNEAVESPNSIYALKEDQHPNEPSEASEASESSSGEGKPALEYEPNASMLASLAMALSGGNPLNFTQNPGGVTNRGLWMIGSDHAAEFNLKPEDFRVACYTPAEAAQIAVSLYHKYGPAVWQLFVSLP